MISIRQILEKILFSEVLVKKFPLFTWKEGFPSEIQDFCVFLFIWVLFLVSCINFRTADVPAQFVHKLKFLVQIMHTDTHTPSEPHLTNSLLWVNNKVWLPFAQILHSILGPYVD